MLSESEQKLAAASLKIRSDLLARGFQVRDVPSGIEPRPNDFDGAEISVHLFSHQVDPLNEAHQQYALGALRAAIAHSRTNPQFHIFVWAEPVRAEQVRAEQDRAEPGAENDGGLNAVDRLLRTEEWVGFSTEFVQTTIEDFKSLIYDRLVQSIPVSRELTKKIDFAPGRSPSGSNAQLYVIFDPQDALAVAPMAKYLESQGIRVLLPNYAAPQADGLQTSALQAGGTLSAADMRAIHNENLRRCDAALIIYGNVHEPWVRMKLQDLLRSPALGRSRNLSARGVYLCAGMTESKRRFSAPGMMILQGSPAASQTPTAQADFASTLGPLIQQLTVAS